MYESPRDDYRRNNMLWEMPSGLQLQIQVQIANTPEVRLWKIAEKKTTNSNLQLIITLVDERVQCPLCRQTKNFSAIAVLYDVNSVHSLDTSLSE